MPPELLLRCPCRQLYELNFERPEPLRICHGEFFQRIGSTHAYHLVVMMHAVYEGRKQGRLPAYGLHHQVGATNGSPIATPEFIQDGELGAHRQRGFTFRQSDGPVRDIEHIRCEPRLNPLRRLALQHVRLQWTVRIT